jgi:hypothetical protein
MVGLFIFSVGPQHAKLAKAGLGAGRPAAYYINKSFKKARR